MDLMTAARGLVRRFRGGEPAMAVLLGKSKGVLSNELAGKHEFAKLGLLDAQAMTDESGDLSILEAWVVHARCMLLRLPEHRARADRPVLVGLSAVAKEFSDVVVAVSDAVKDNDVSDNELEAITQELGELVSEINSLYGDVRALNESGQPMELRRSALVGVVAKARARERARRSAKA